MPAPRVEPFLLEDEQLLGSCGGRGWTVCVTDRRLLRVGRGLLGPRMDDLSYREVSSVGIDTRPASGLVLLGLVLLALGVVLPRVAPSILALLESGRALHFTPLGEQTLFALGVVLLVAGLALLCFGALRRHSVVSLAGPFLLRARRQRARWTFPAPTPSDARVFAQLVRAQLHGDGAADRNKVLPYEA